MMVKTKPNQKIHVAKLQITSEKLGSLKEKPKEELTLRESIYFLRDKLKSALKKGYSYQDLSEILAEQEILISAATLKQYLTEIQKKSASRQKKSKSAASSKSKSSQTSSSSSSSLKSTENVTNFTKELDKDLEKVKPKLSPETETVSNLDSPSSSEVELSHHNSQRESTTSQPKTRKSVRAKSPKLSGSNPDLSSEFNQY